MSQSDRSPLNIHHRRTVDRTKQSAQIPLEPGCRWDTNRFEQTDQWILGHPFRLSSTNSSCQVRTGQTSRCLRAPDGCQTKCGCLYGDHCGDRQLRGWLSVRFTGRKGMLCQSSSSLTSMPGSMWTGGSPISVSSVHQSIRRSRVTSMSSAGLSTMCSELPLMVIVSSESSILLAMTSRSWEWSVYERGRQWTDSQYRVRCGRR